MFQLLFLLVFKLSHHWSKRVSSCILLGPFLEKFGFNWWIICLQRCVTFCHTLTRISHRHTYMSPTSWTSVPPPTPSHPSGLSQSTGLSSLHHTANFPWFPLFHMVMYMCQHYSPSVPPLLPHLCPQVCALRLCLSSCPANKFISTIFLDSIYMY